jgi:hypothetical protein
MANEKEKTFYRLALSVYRFSFVEVLCDTIVLPFFSFPRSVVRDSKIVFIACLLYSHPRMT